MAKRKTEETSLMFHHQATKGASNRSSRGPFLSLLEANINAATPVAASPSKTNTPNPPDARITVYDDDYVIGPNTDCVTPASPAVFKPLDQPYRYKGPYRALSYEDPARLASFRGPIVFPKMGFA